MVSNGAVSQAVSAWHRVAKEDELDLYVFEVPVGKQTNFYNKNVMETIWNCVCNLSDFNY